MKVGRGDPEGSSPLSDKAKTLRDQLDSIEKALIQTKDKTPFDRLRPPQPPERQAGGAWWPWSALPTPPRPGRPTRSSTRSAPRFDVEIARLREVCRGEAAAFNQLAREAGFVPLELE